MKLSELKSRSRARIVLLVSSIVILAVLSGCAQVSVTQDAQGFYPEYYASKELTAEDVVKLRGYASSLNPFVSDSASLILGKYYITYGDPTYGALLINKSYKSEALDEQMKLFGQLWKMDLDIVERNQADAMVIAKNISAMDKTEIFNRTVKIYCDSNNFYSKAIVSGSDACYSTLRGQSPIEIITTDDSTMSDTASMTYDEYLAMLGVIDNSTIYDVDNQTGIGVAEMGDVTLNILAESSSGNVENGIMYAISTAELPFIVNSITKAQSMLLDSDDVLINIDNLEIISGDESTNFAVNWEELIYTASLMSGTSDYDVVIVSTSGKKMPLANYLETLLKGRGLDVTVLNYDNQNYQTHIQGVMEGNIEKKVLSIGIGSETELHKFTPIAKFVEKDRSRETILLITESIGNLSRYPGFREYYRNLFVLTPINTVDNEQFMNVNKSFEQFFGTPMNEENMMGYDLVMYLKHVLQEQTDSYTTDYLTGVVGFYENMPYRPIKMYYINNERKFEQTMPLDVKIMEQPKPIEEENVEQKTAPKGTIMIIDDTL